MLRSGSALGLTIALLAAGSAAATDPAPRRCGDTPSGTYAVRVDRGSTCGFGMATYRAIAARNDFVSAVSKNFTVRVSSAGHATTMDCRANARAHGQFDFACNTINRGGSQVVVLANKTLP
jgi:ribosomal protein L37E